MDSGLPAGAQCTPDSVCPTGLVCIRGLCRVGAAACQQSSDCTATDAPVCDAAARACRACQTSMECAQKDPSRPLCAGDGTCRVQTCTADGQCPDSTPLCDGERCTTCPRGEAGDALCAMRDQTRPYCTTGGGCGACADSSHCPAQAPVCGTSTGTCRPCQAHKECATGVCYTDSGTCASAQDVLYVDPASGSNSGECTQATPCATIGAAVARVTPERRFVHIRPTVYREALSLSGKTAVLISEGATLQPPAEQEGIPVISVGSGADLTIEGLRIQRARGGSNADGIRCAGADASLRLITTTVTENDAFGVEIAQCTLTMERSTVSRNRGGGISILDADFAITNSMIVDNGDAATAFLGGIRVENSMPRQTQTLAFNTIARNLVQSSAQASGVRCNTATPMTASSNIVYHGFGSVPALSGNCAWAYSNIEGGAPGDTNLDQDPRFVDTVNGDYHLRPDSPCRDAADPESDVDIDFDGDPRPLGNAPDMGADEITAPPMP